MKSRFVISQFFSLIGNKFIFNLILCVSIYALIMCSSCKDSRHDDFENNILQQEQIWNEMNKKVSLMHMDNDAFYYAILKLQQDKSTLDIKRITENYDLAKELLVHINYIKAKLCENAEYSPDLETKQRFNLLSKASYIEKKDRNKLDKLLSNYKISSNSFGSKEISLLNIEQLNRTDNSLITILISLNTLQDNILYINKTIMSSNVGKHYK